MSQHRETGTSKGAIRAEIERTRAELRAVTEAITGHEPRRFAVAETSGDGRLVLRPVMPRRQGTREALRGTRYPAAVLPLPGALGGPGRPPVPFPAA